MGTIELRKARQSLCGDVRCRPLSVCAAAARAGECATRFIRFFKQTDVIITAPMARIAKAMNMNTRRIQSSIGNVVENFQSLSRVVNALAESKSWLRDDEYLDMIKNELSKEPVLHSKFGVSGGETYITATLTVFAVNLQRRFEVENRLNKMILERFDEKLLFTKRA